MNSSSLAALKRKYPAALYTFLRVQRPDRALQDFLADPDVNPTFQYPRRLTAGRVQELIESLKADIGVATDKEAKEFLRHRLQEAMILLQFVSLHSGPVSDTQLERYRAAMIELYGPLAAAYFNGAATYLAAMARDCNDQAALSALEEIRWRPTPLLAPDRSTFLYYRDLLRQHVPKIFNPISEQLEPGTAIASALEETELAADGWKVRSVQHAASVAVGRHTKNVYVGVHYNPASLFRLRQVIAHEVYGHARRTIVLGDRVSLNEEGIALVYEQLLARRFMYKRMLRYMTLCLAWGVDGVPRDFVTTYRLMVPLVRMVSPVSKTKAQQVAFREVLRAFRGGNPAVPGMVILKDKVYFEDNLKVWQYLAVANLSKEAFGRLMDGYEDIPGRNVS